MLNLKNLTFYLNSLRAEREQLISMLEGGFDSYLSIRQRKNRKDELFLHYRSSDRSSIISKYVSNSMMPFAKDAAAHMLTECQLSDINIKINALEELIHAFSEPTAVDLLLQEKPWINPLLPGIVSNDAKMMEWKNEKYERNFEHPEDLIHNTIIPGLVVRSKSEAQIISLYEHYQIPYHYDEFIMANGIRLAIDFICINVSTGKKWYWDHRGMMDDPHYIEKTLFCERQFMKAGILQGINLIVTTETSSQPLDILEVEELIKHYLL